VDLLVSANPGTTPWIGIDTEAIAGWITEPT
jgi:hypothetical protein